MWPDQVLNPGPLTYESGALPTALPGPAAPLEANIVFVVGILRMYNICDKNPGRCMSFFPYSFHSVFSYELYSLVYMYVSCVSIIGSMVSGRFSNRVVRMKY